MNYLAAILDKNVEQLRDLAATGEDVNSLCPDMHGDLWLPLGYAASKNPALVGEVLRLGADPRRVDAVGWTALIYACCRQEQGQHLKSVRLLLEAGASAAQSEDPEGRKPLHFAPISALRSGLEVARLLCAAGADPHAVDANGKTALHEAVARGDLPLTEFLLEHGVKVDAKRALSDARSLHEHHNGIKATTALLRRFNQLP